MVFHVPQKRIAYPNIYIESVLLENVDSFTFLGIFIDKPSEEFELTASTQQAHMKPHG